MFYRKLVTYIVLVLYGVPTSLGPYWHSHSGHTPCGGAQAQAIENIASRSAHSLARSCTCSHGHAGPAKANTNARTYVTVSQLSAANCTCDGACAICQFYASAPFLMAGSVQIASSSLVEIWSPPVVNGYIVFSLSPHARGPPCPLGAI